MATHFSTLMGTLMLRDHISGKVVLLTLKMPQLYCSHHSASQVLGTNQFHLSLFISLIEKHP